MGAFLLAMGLLVAWLVVPLAIASVISGIAPLGGIELVAVYLLTGVGIVVIWRRLSRRLWPRRSSGGGH